MAIWFASSMLIEIFLSLPPMLATTPKKRISVLSSLFFKLHSLAMHYFPHRLPRFVFCVTFKIENH